MMEVNSKWNRETMHEEVRRHWGIRAERSEMVARRNGIEQVAFGIGEEWTYELRVSAGICGWGVNWRT
jgi:hypothetical protein